MALEVKLDGKTAAAHLWAKMGGEGRVHGGDRAGRGARKGGLYRVV